MLELNKEEYQNLLIAWQKYIKKDENVLKERLKEYYEIPNFDPSGNIHDVYEGFNEEHQFLIRWIAGLKMTEVLKALKFNLNDPNVLQDLNDGNIGTAQRFTKSMVGSNLESNDEIASGRFAKRPRIAKFPNTSWNNEPVIKTVDVTSLCGHHLLPYGNKVSKNAKVVLGYIPNEYVIGLSKLQKLTDYVCRRPSIQEDLTNELAKELKLATGSNDVFVIMSGIRHSCEFLRSSRSESGDFTTYHLSGKFKDPKFRSSFNI